MKIHVKEPIAGTIFVIFITGGGHCTSLSVREHILLRSEGLTLLNIKHVVLWDVPPCILVLCVYHTMQLQVPEDDDDNNIVIGNE
jgi:hypothetical protein